MKKLISLSSLLLIIIASFAQTPEWIDFEKRKQLSATLYYTAFVENEYERKDNPQALLEEMKNKASLQLSSSIKVTVQGLTTNIISETEKEYQSYFQQAATSYTNVELVGLKYETYNDEKNRKLYVLAKVKKRELNDYYLKQLNQKIAAVDQEITKAEKLIKASNQTEAQKSYTKAESLVRECESFQSLLMAMGKSGADEIGIEKVKQFNKRLGDIQLALKSSTNRSVADLGNFLGEALANEIPTKSKLKISYITYGDTKMPSIFSRRFADALTQAIGKKGNFTIVDKPDKNTILIKGTYWETGDNLRISLIAQNEKGSVLAAASDIISKSQLQSDNISYKAENFQDAYQRQQAFRKDEVVSSDMVAEVWTNKGAENLLFEEGDIMKLFLRVNMPAYVRVIYYMADGSKVMLLDNYYIDQTKVNKVIEIPDEFECAEPFGFETMQILAQTKAFSPLVTEKKYGYDFIVQETKQIVANTRGFKKVENKDKSAEMRLNFTTVKK
jgi:hypothetical protein